MRPRFRLRPLIAVLVLAVAVASCADNDDDADSAASTSEANAAFHDISDDPVVVSGTAICLFSSAGDDPEGGSGWLVTCELDMSDPRVSGTETHNRIRIVSGGAVGDVWVAEEALIANAEGTWRGIAQAADDGRPSGEAHYFGEGAYEGLEFHYYFGQFPEEYDDETAVIRGWISDGG